MRTAAQRLRALATGRTVIATEGNAEYLRGLNLKALQKTHKKSPEQEPRAFFEKLQQLAKRGPLFNVTTLGAVEELTLPMEKTVVQWLGTQLQKDETLAERLWSMNIERMRWEQEFRNVLDYFGHEHPNLDALTLAQAHEASVRWHEQFKPQEEVGPYATHDVVKKWPDGFTMVKLSPEDCKTEGKLMGHCVENYAEEVENGSTEIYSLRDPKNRPHVTIEVNPTRHEVDQIQGKENKTPVAKYHPYLSEWLSENDLHAEDTVQYMDAKTLHTWAAQLLKSKATARGLGKLDLIFEHERTSPHTLAMIADDILARPNLEQYVAKLRTIGYDERTPPETLMKLALLHDHELHEVQEAVANNPRTPGSVLARVVLDEEGNVRERIVVDLLFDVARNPHTKPDTLRALYEHHLHDKSWEGLRMLVRKNPNAPEDLRDLPSTTLSSGAFDDAYASE